MTYFPGRRTLTQFVTHGRSDATPTIAFPAVGHLEKITDAAAMTISVCDWCGFQQRQEGKKRRQLETKQTLLMQVTDIINTE